MAKCVKGCECRRHFAQGPKMSAEERRKRNRLYMRRRRTDDPEGMARHILDWRINNADRIKDYRRATQAEHTKRARFAYPRQRARIIRVRSLIDTSNSLAPWTVDDDQIVMRNDLTTVEAAVLCRRTPHAVETRRWVLVHTPEAAAECHARRDFAANNIDEIVRMRQERNLRRRKNWRTANRDRINFQNRKKQAAKSGRPVNPPASVFWTPEKDRFVVRNDLPGKELASVLGTSLYAVYTRRSKLRRHSQHDPYGKETPL